MESRNLPTSGKVCRAVFLPQTTDTSSEYPSCEGTADCEFLASELSPIYPILDPGTCVSNQNILKRALPHWNWSTPDGNKTR